MSIVTMEHVSFVVVQQEYSALLMRLMHLGCVELHTAAIESVPPLALRSEEGELSRAQQEYQLLIQATEDLRQIGGVRAPLLQKRREVAEKRMWLRRFGGMPKRWSMPGAVWRSGRNSALR